MNIQDIIIAVNLVVNGEYNSNADMNSDQTVNILDIIQIVNIILNNQIIQSLYINNYHKLEYSNIKFIENWINQKSDK